MSGGAIRHGSGKPPQVYLGPAELIQRLRSEANRPQPEPGQ